MLYELFWCQCSFWSESSSGEGIWIQDWVIAGCFPSQLELPSVDHMAASAAHVAQYALKAGATSEKKWSILVLLLAISSFLEGRPTLLPVLM
jgi:hypothetical protein